MSTTDYLKNRINQIIDQRKDYLFAIAYYRVRSRQDAEDIVQEAFLRLWKHGPLLHDLQDIDLYLYRIIYNLCADHHRNCAHFVGEEEIPDCAHDDADQELEKECQRVSALLASLPENQREIIEMHVHDSLTFAQIHSITDIPESTIKSRYQSAITNLRKMLINHE